jgi:hypothetical protein
MKALISEKCASTHHESLKYSMPSFPINGAFDGVTGFFPDSSARSSRATLLTSAEPFNPLGHSPAASSQRFNARHSPQTYSSAFSL